MCTGAEALLGAQIFGGVTSGLSAAKSLLSGSKPKAVASDPVADAAKAADKAAQDAASAKLESSRRIRANSLLSAYSQDPAAKQTLGA